MIIHHLLTQTSLDPEDKMDLAQINRASALERL